MQVPSLDIHTGSVLDFPLSITLLSCREQFDIVAQSPEQVTFFGQCEEGCPFCASPLVHKHESLEMAEWV